MAVNDIRLRMSQLSDEIREVQVEAEKLQDEVMRMVGERVLHVKHGVAIVRAVDHLQHAVKHLRMEGRAV